MRSNAKYKLKRSLRAGQVKSDEQIEIENKRSEAIEKLKRNRLTKAKVRNGIKRIYDHLPDPAIEYITSIFLKYNLCP